MAIKWVKEINIVNREYNSTSISPERVSIDPNQFSGTKSWYFEVVTGSSGSTCTWYLRNSADTTTYALPTCSTANSRVRSVIASPPTSAVEFAIKSSTSGYGAKAARIIIIQSHATAITSTETQIEIGSYEAGLFGGDIDTPNVCTYPKYWQYNSDSWDGTITSSVEVVWVEANDKYSFSCALQRSSNQTDWTTLFTFVNAEASETVTRSRAFFGAGMLVDGYYYRIIHWNTGDKDTRGYTIYCAKIIINQADATEITKTESTRLLVHSLVNSWFEKAPSAGMSLYNYTSSITSVGNSFTGTGDPLNRITVTLAKTGAPTGNIVAKIYSHSGVYGTSSVPNELLYTSTNSIDISTVLATPGTEHFLFDSCDLDDETYYVFAIEYTNGDGSNYLQICYMDEPWTSGNMCHYDGSWSADSDDLYYALRGNVLGNFDQYYDDDEFDGVTVDSYHEAMGILSAAAKLQEDPNGTPSDISNSTVTCSESDELTRGGSALGSITDNEEVDTNVYEGKLYLSRIVHIITIASTGYTLTAAAGTHSVSGTAAGLLQSIILSAAAGTYSVSGTAANLLISYLLDAAEGVHAVTGTAANFLRSYAVLANAGTHSVSGTAAGTLYSRIFSVDPGTHSVVGTAAGLSKIFVVLAESGTYVVTGTAADLLQSIILEAGVGVHSVTGTAAGVLYSRVFGVDPGTHSLTGTVVDFLRSYLVDASPGSHSLSGSEVDFLRSYLVDAGVGSHSVTGSDVNFLRSLIMSLAAGVHSVTGTDAILEKLVGYVLNADPGTYLVTGPAAQLLYSRIMSVDSGTHSVTGTAADIFRLFTLQANAGIVSVTGTNADLLRSMLLDAQAGTHGLTGTEADLLRSLLLNAEAGTVNLVGTDADLLMSRLLSAVPGVVSVSGTDADLLRSLLLSAGVGSYSVVGTDADLLLIQGYVLQAESGTYIVTGVAADLIYSGTGVKPDYIILHRRRRRT